MVESMRAWARLVRADDDIVVSVLIGAPRPFNLGFFLPLDFDLFFFFSFLFFRLLLQSDSVNMDGRGWMDEWMDGWWSKLLIRRPLIQKRRSGYFLAICNLMPRC